MGEVWRATDTKLGRDVALKILPASFARDPARMARFEREAKALASCNHPHIAQIYGVEEGALVMELVEGEPLHGPLPIEKAVAYAGQMLCGRTNIFSTRAPRIWTWPRTANVSRCSRCRKTRPARKARCTSPCSSTFSTS